MAELLLELLSEEIPARMQARAAEDLKRLVTDKLKAAGLALQSAEATVTPRRLTLVVQGLPARQPDRREERKGPREGAPEQAVQGFLKASGLKSLAEAELRESDKGKFYFTVREIAGQPTMDLLPALVAEIVSALAWPKSMRWGNGTLRYVRPLQSLLCLFDGKAVAGSLALGGGGSLSFESESRGHRFLAPAPVAVSSFADYKQKLEAAYVILDPAVRRERIALQSEALARAAGCTVKEDPALLDEVVGLVEWPVVLLGRIDSQFMELPAEVLTTAMRSHQKYFSLLDAKGALADRFLLVANMETADGGRTVVAGNERVLRARLSDARFFWDQDRKVSLASRAPRLAEIVFHARLGTLDEKIDRVQALAAAIARNVPGADLDRVRSATRLAKADLVTGMVGEFPELQGVMGRYYALHDGEHAEVAEAIAEHYSPLGPNDRCPSAPVSVAVALADKLDTLAGFWAIGEKPTGSKDPYALRRAALGVIRLILENKLRLSLTELLTAALDGYSRKVKGVDPTALAADLLDFFADRLKVALRD
ncbi:MAG: glycine--tRNA ligase subunit beta, partial [Geminicoccales bacterium]